MYSKLFIFMGNKHSLNDIMPYDGKVGTELADMGMASWLMSLHVTYMQNIFWEVVVAQLVEQLLPKLEVCSSNPVIGKF